MLKYLLVWFTLILLSNTALGIEVTEQELDQFVHRYLNTDVGHRGDRHCHDGYCYFGISRGNIDVYWRNYGDEEYLNNLEYILKNNTKIKIETNEAQAIVRDLLRQHLDIFDHLSEIITNPKLLPYLEKYETLKMRSTSKPLSPGLKIIIVGDQHISPHLTGGGGMARCDFSEGLVIINANSWNGCIKHDDILKEFLIFHEIAHCDLKRRHNDGIGDLLSFMDNFLIGEILKQTLNGPIESCRSTIDTLNLYLYEYSDQSIDRSYIEDNLEQLYTELFSQDRFYDNYDGWQHENHDDYTEVADLSEFTTVVNNDLIAIKQKLQRLARDFNNKTFKVHNCLSYLFYGTWQSGIPYSESKYLGTVI